MACASCRTLPRARVVGAAPPTAARATPSWMVRGRVTRVVPLQLLARHVTCVGAIAAWACTVPGQFSITFDDGPVSGTTEPVIDELTTNKIPGSFFVVGVQVDKFGSLLQAEEAAGFSTFR